MLSKQSISRCFSRVAVVAAGIIVLTAAALKYHFALTDPGPVVTLTDSELAAVTLIGAELFFGLWSLIGVYPHLLRVVGGALFTVFCVASVMTLADGNKTCSCFGRVTIPPGLTAIVDAAMAFALWYLPPGEEPKAWGARRPGWVIAILLTIVVATTVPLAVHRAVFEPQSIVIDQRHLDFGSIVVGGRKELVVPITNTTSRLITITSFRTSCPCLSVWPVEIPPRTTASLVLVYDGSAQNRMAGGYRITFAAIRSESGVAFIGHVDIKVIADQDNESP
ncbi:MauE/DoxX family redox-associated membrane protein [Frigoriglobus tundricola]|uniref:Methylamine utilisation protein MauE domain-containing protein n=1 Tax=Frigoriglobus tundricola TaxID=2774151 RepID=A0A6M5YYB8_9BACT|nr:DUF1573 domain-containing protein [Frigoriglobus tundricola]QJW98426.1 hypothetical protein FTUN_6016 [Frigoriglobus tundricola]